QRGRHAARRAEVLASSHERRHRERALEEIRLVARHERAEARHDLFPSHDYSLRAIATPSRSGRITDRYSWRAKRVRLNWRMPSVAASRAAGSTTFPDQSVLSASR